MPPLAPARPCIVLGLCDAEAAAGPHTPHTPAPCPFLFPVDLPSSFHKPARRWLNRRACSTKRRSSARLCGHTRCCTRERSRARRPPLSCRTFWGLVNASSCPPSLCPASTARGLASSLPRPCRRQQTSRRRSQPAGSGALTAAPTTHRTRPHRWKVGRPAPLVWSRLSSPRLWSPGWCRRQPPARSKRSKRAKGRRAGANGRAVGNCVGGTLHRKGLFTGARCRPVADARNAQRAAVRHPIRTRATHGGRGS